AIAAGTGGPGQDEGHIMSLTSFLKLRDVAARVKPLRPKTPRKIDAPLRVEPRSNRYMMVGRAFDYLLRFELQRLAPHAVVETWVAEAAPDIIWGPMREGVAIGVDLLKDFESTADYLPPAEVSQRARAIVERAKSAVASYLKSKTPTRAQRSELAAH